MSNGYTVGNNACICTFNTLMNEVGRQIPNSTLLRQLPSLASYSSTSASCIGHPFECTKSIHEMCYDNSKPLCTTHVHVCTYTYLSHTCFSFARTAALFSHMPLWNSLALPEEMTIYSFTVATYISLDYCATWMNMRRHGLKVFIL